MILCIIVNYLELKIFILILHIKNKIISEKYNILIIDKTKINCNDNEIVCFSLNNGGLFLLFILSFIYKTSNKNSYFKKRNKKKFA